MINDSLKINLSEEVLDSLLMENEKLRLQRDRCVVAFKSLDEYYTTLLSIVGTVQESITSAQKDCKILLHAFATLVDLEAIDDDRPTGAGTG